jgi:sugar O-acyltransferase (sialic acid O-acetyltransferase NeuD family)
MTKILAILGAGQLGHQIAHYATNDKHYDRVVFFDDFINEKEVFGFKLIGKIQEVEEAYHSKMFDELIIGIGYKHLAFRKELFERFSSKIPFGIIIHSASWIDDTVTVKEGVVIYPNCCVEANSIIDSNSILNISCSIAHDSYVGKHCFLSPRVAMAGFVKVGDQCIIGINATIIDNVEIKMGSQIGGGTVVIKDILTRGLYVGNPAKFIK